MYEVGVSLSMQCSVTPHRRLGLMFIINGEPMVDLTEVSESTFAQFILFGMYLLYTTT